ncbi:hypothetical protein Tco_0392979 [Tanacetum coccineum]
MTDHLIRRIPQLDTTYLTFYLGQRIEFYTLNNVSVLPNNMTMIASCDDTMNGNGEHANSRIITNSELKISDEFLKILQDNTFNGMDGEDVIDHIANVLEITEWIKMPNVEKNELRLHVFSNSLSGDAKTWLWEFYVNERAKGMIDDLNEYKEPCKENTKKTCLDTFYKPYLDAHEAKDIYEVINREYSPIPIPAHRNMNNPDELCRTEEFTVIRHSIGNDEEFFTVGPSKINDVERTPGLMSCIYHELFNRKDRGWEVTQTRNHMTYPRVWDTAY